MFHVWQMNDGRWHISAVGGRSSVAMSDDNMRIWRAGFDHGFDSKAEAEAARRMISR